MMTLAVRKGSADLRVPRQVARGDFDRNFRGMREAETATWLELLLVALCMVDRLSSDFGEVDQFVWTVGPMVERVLLDVDI